MRPDAYVNGDVDLRLLAEALRGAKYVFFINDRDIVVALEADFLSEPNQNFITGWSDIPGFDAERVERFLRENNIAYHAIPPDFPDEVVSPDGRFVARADGIYLVKTNEKIVGGISWVRGKGWVNDGHGAIYSSFFGGPCLLRFGLPLADDIACILRVPQPVVLLKVPEEYLISVEIP